ncbi:hypothetical protein G7054_g1998 [Neopestalotiopsis clavispora]|jgi:hypothetical protein|nr:hypothetical protein G7054_g1998 [Neopestalotiopsis clavispora]
MAESEAYHDQFRFAEVYRPVFTKFTVTDADTCRKIILTFANASHFRLNTWRLNDKGLPDAGNRLSFQSRDVVTVLEVVDTYRQYYGDTLRSHGQVFDIVIAAPRYLSDRALHAVHKINLDVANKVTLEPADVSDQFSTLCGNCDKCGGNKNDNI